MPPTPSPKSAKSSQKTGYRLSPQLKEAFFEWPWASGIDGLLAKLETRLGGVEAKAVSAGDALAGSFAALGERVGQRMADATTGTRAARAGRGGLTMPHEGEEREEVHRRRFRAPHEHELHEPRGHPSLRRSSLAREHHESGRNRFGEQVEVGMNLGMLGTMGFGEVTEAMKSTLEHAFELMHVQQQMGQGGFSQTEIAKATSAAWKESAASGQDVVKVLEDIKELTFPLGNVGEAIDFTTNLEKMRVVLNAVSPGSGNSSKEAVYEMARTGELKGLSTEEEFQSYFDNMTKVISATGGKITPRDYMQMMKYGRLASMGWNEEFVTQDMPTMMNALGASGAGTAAMSLFGTLVQGKMSKPAFENIDALGLIGDRDKINYENGKFKGLKPGAIKGTEELTANPYKWVEDILKPLMVQKYGDLKANKEKVIDELGGLFGNRMSAQAIAELLVRDASVGKDIGQIGKAKGIGGADDLLNNDPNTVITKLETSFGNLLTAIGGQSGKNAIEIMNSMASTFNWFTDWFNEHPLAGKLFVSGAAGLAAGLAAMVVYGAVLAAAGTEYIVAFGALAFSLAEIARAGWPEIVIAARAIGAFVARVESIAIDAVAWLPTLPALPSFGREADGPPIPLGMQTPSGIDPSTPGFVPMAYRTNFDGSSLGGAAGTTSGGVSDSSRALEDVVYRGTLRALTAFKQQNGGTSGGAFGGAVGGGATHEPHTAGGRSQSGGALALPPLADPVRRAGVIVAAAHGDRAQVAAAMADVVARAKPLPTSAGIASPLGGFADHEALRPKQPASSATQAGALDWIIDTKHPERNTARFGAAEARKGGVGATKPANDDVQPHREDVLNIALMVEGKPLAFARHVVSCPSHPNARVAVRYAAG